MSKVTKIVCVVAYVGIAIAFCGWQDAMDAHYGVAPEASRSSLVALVLSVAWPIALPAALIVVATGGAGRWHLSPLPPSGREAP
jgi:hypothetical protein